MNVISEEFLGFVQNNLPTLLRKFGSPLHLYYGPGIRKTLRGIKSAFGDQQLDITEFFALKALPRKAIAEIVLEEGGGYDCSSPAEVRLAREVKAAPDLIMLTSNDTPVSLYEYALADGGCILNLDDRSYVRKVPDPFPKLISFRLNPGKILFPGEKSDELEFSSEGAKFGVPPDDIKPAYRSAIDRGAEALGIHLMVLSNNRNYKKTVTVIEREFQIFSDVITEFGIPGALVNIGGGIGIPYRLEDPTFDMLSLARECKVIAGKFAQKHGYIPKLCMESGRYVTGPHGVLINRVENVFTKFSHKFLGVEIGLQGIPRVAFYSKTAYHHPIILRPDGSIKDGPLELVSIVGPVCEDNDRLATDVLLPVAEEGDYVVSCCSAAHCADQAPPYNWQPHPQELLFDGGIARRISRVEVYEDFMRRQRGLEGQEHTLDLR